MIKLSVAKVKTRIQIAFGLLLTLLGTSCATAQITPARSGPFSFAQDTFAFSNELVWEYFFDENGKWANKRREPKPDYTHHCFVVARSARQFFQNARFDPNQPTTDDETYQKLIRKVVSIPPRKNLDEKNKIIIPGYANLREFSQAQEKLLKENCGAATQSYFQRGHWRIMLPFTKRQNEKMARQLLNSIEQNRPPIVHLVRFPQLTINHAVIFFGATKTKNSIQFSVYDPNKPDKPATLHFDRKSKTFNFPSNDYFIGGKVNVYEIYHSLLF
ncbi:MAG: hypothetical protein M3Y82_08170 [Verrucomicrobiota bacterium]|nr:hypothetical protein [Verrucomicrobiota bacterium]